jgi:hypothetical protein
MITPERIRQISASLQRWDDPPACSIRFETIFARAIEVEVRKEIAGQLKNAGAKLPVENDGTIESAMNTGLSIALALVEEPAPTSAQKEDGDASKTAPAG